VIKDETTARLVSELMIDIVSRLDASTAMAEEVCPPEEFKVYRRAVGGVIGEIVLEILNPLYKAHPSLKPAEME
jgi:hypothetical protein